MKGYSIENVGGTFHVSNPHTGQVVGKFIYKHAMQDFLHKQPALEAPVKKPARARGKGGKLKADDPSTPEVNEAWEGGKAPAKKKAPAKRKAKKKAKK